MTKLAIPRNAIRAAKKYGKQELGLSKPSMGDLESRLMHIRDNFSYGIAQAVESGYRMRWLHQMDPKEVQFNCAEAGYNVYAIFKAFFPDENFEVIRYTPFWDTASHFGIVHNRGDRIRMTDPLMNLHGDIELENDRFKYFPMKWMEEHGKDVPFAWDNLERSRPTKDVPLLITGRYAILDEDAMMRHMNHINGDLGLLPYLADGQRIITDSTDGHIIEYSVQMHEDGLYLRATGTTGDVPFLTLERHYDLNSSMDYSERFLLHTDLAWAAPGSTIYIFTKDTEQVGFDNIGFSGTEIMAAHYVATNQRRNPLYTERQRADFFAEMKQKLEAIGKGGTSNSISDLFSFGLVNLPPDGDSYDVLKDQIEYLESLDEESRAWELDFRMHRGDFMGYLMGDSRWPEIEYLNRVRPQAKKLEDALAGKMRNYMNDSPVIQGLLLQYKETISLLEHNQEFLEQAMGINAILE